MEIHINSLIDNLTICFDKDAKISFKQIEEMKQKIQNELTKAISK